MDVLFFHFIAQQRRHVFGIEAGLVAVKELAHGAGDLLAQGKDGNAHGAGALTFAAASAAASQGQKRWNRISGLS